MPSYIFNLLPYLVLLCGTAGLAAVVVGIWRVFIKSNAKGWDGLYVGLAGTLLLLACLGSWTQYQASSKGRLDGCKSILVKSVASALEMYAQDHGKLPGSLSELTPTYLKSVPACPAAGRDTYSKGYQKIRLQEADKYGYKVVCSGCNHPGLSIPDRPAFDSVEGASGSGNYH